jgi:hypothetical protein
MLRRTVEVACSLALGIAGIPDCAAQAPSAHYHLTRRISGPDGLWDYASVDEQARRLFVGRQGGILSLDLDDAAGTPTRLWDSPVVHQVLPIGRGRLLATTGESDILAILKIQSPALVAQVPVSGHDPDSVAYDQKTGLAVTFNRGSHDATLIDPATAKAVGQIPLPGAPEFSASDDQGTVYVNIADRAQIAVLDLTQQKVVKTIGLPGCKQPSGLALDAQTKLLISACDNGVAKFVTTDGRDGSTVKIGEAPDAAFIDTQRRLVFIPSGGSGTLAVISIANEANITLLQTVKTQHGTRTGAVDPRTGTVYLPTGKLKPPAAPAKWPSVVPRSFEILVISP